MSTELSPGNIVWHVVTGPQCLGTVVDVFTDADEVVVYWMGTCVEHTAVCERITGKHERWELRKVGEEE